MIAKAIQRSFQITAKVAEPDWDGLPTEADLRSEYICSLSFRNAYDREVHQIDSVLLQDLPDDLDQEDWPSDAVTCTLLYTERIFYFGEQVGNQGKSGQRTYSRQLQATN